jgi:nucleotidyltransferase substrate binding protein (TIGR01987 family)
MEIRWEQRFANYVKALEKLSEGVHWVHQQEGGLPQGVIHVDSFLDDIIKEGIIQRFEYTHELAWNVMKDFLLYSGLNNITGSRDAIRSAHLNGLLQNGEVWMDMIRSRNQTSHTYHEETADEVFWNIVRDYHPEFVAFKDEMGKRKGSDQ